jgi:hypothetical protein
MASISQNQGENAVAETFMADLITWCTRNELAKASLPGAERRLQSFWLRPIQLMAIDKGGIGMNLHEDLAYLYPSKVRGVSFAPAVKERLAKKVKIAFEEKKVRIPNDPSLVSHILSIKRTANRTSAFTFNSESSEHHGDKFWALALALDWAAGKKLVEFSLYEADLGLWQPRLAGEPGGCIWCAPGSGKGGI